MLSFMLQEKELGNILMFFAEHHKMTVTTAVSIWDFKLDTLLVSWRAKAQQKIVLYTRFNSKLITN